MRYDDMSGLDMYDGMDGLGALLDPAMLQEYLMAAGAGAGAILLGTWLMPKLPAPSTWTGAEEVKAHRMRAALATVGGVALGAFLMKYNRGVGLAVMGGVGGLGLAQLIDSFVDQNFVGTPFGQLSADADDSNMSGFAGDEDASAALSALEAAGVSASRPAFGDPTVSRERLQGLGAATVQAETLGGYQPWLA